MHNLEGLEAMTRRWEKNLRFVPPFKVHFMTFIANKIIITGNMFNLYQDILLFYMP